MNVITKDGLKRVGKIIGGSLFIGFCAFVGCEGISLFICVLDWAMENLEGKGIFYLCATIIAAIVITIATEKKGS